MKTRTTQTTGEPGRDGFDRRQVLLFADLHAFRTLGLEGQPAILLGADILYRCRRVELDYGSRRMGFGGLQPRPGPPVA